MHRLWLVVATIATVHFVTVVSFGDFVEGVVCTASGMRIRLKNKLPTPVSGMWDLEVEGHPKCPGVSKTDVGGGYEFTILYADKQWCGVDAQYYLTPAWVAYSKVVLVIKDEEGMAIADSVSCVYDTRFDASLMTFEGEITNQNLQYGGTLADQGADIEATVKSSDAVRMDFFDQIGRQLENRKVKLGDPIMLKIDVSENEQVNKVLPENCYFSSSRIPEEDALGAQVLPFIKNSCFNTKHGMVRAFLKPMERDPNSTRYELKFPAFYFTGYGQNLYVHCTILACVGTKNLCEADEQCFASGRRKRDVSNEIRFNGKVTESYTDADAKEMIMTKYIIVEDTRSGEPNIGSTSRSPSYQSQFLQDTVCMQISHFTGLIGTLGGCLIVLLVVVSCLGGRLARRHSRNSWEEKRMWYSNVYTNQPPTYSSSVQSLPTITSF